MMMMMMIPYMDVAPNTLTPSKVGINLSNTHLATESPILCGTAQPWPAVDGMEIRKKIQVTMNKNLWLWHFFFVVRGISSIKSSSLRRISYMQMCKWSKWCAPSLDASTSMVVCTERLELGSWISELEWACGKVWTYILLHTSYQQEKGFVWAWFGVRVGSAMIPTFQVVTDTWCRRKNWMSINKKRYFSNYSIPI